MAYESVDSGSALLTDESQKVTVQLQNGTAVIPQGADIETAKAAIAKALVVNADEVDVKTLIGSTSARARIRLNYRKYSIRKLRGLYEHNNEKNTLEYCNNRI